MHETRSLEGHHDFAALERRLVAIVRQAKERDPRGALAPVAIVAPTIRLIVHLQTRLARSFESLLNVRFFHHDSLARAVVSEAGGRAVRIVADGVKQAVLGRILEEAGGDLADYAKARPGCLASLCATMDDLRESGAEPGAGRAVAGLSPRGQGLLSLYEAYAERLEALAPRGLSDRAGLLKSARSGIGAFAQRFSVVIHYGAYELIGANLDLLKAIETAGVSLVYLAPWHPSSPAYEYARRFWPEALGASPAAIEDPGESDRLLGDRLPGLYDETYAPGALPGNGVSLFHAQGAAAELKEAALRILALHRDHEVPLREVAVIARSLDPYAPLLRPIFSGHGLPFTTSAALGAVREARVQAALQLARAALGDFERRPLLDLFRGGLFLRDGADMSREAHAWDRLSRKWQVARGFETWTRDLPAWVEAWLPYVPDDAGPDERQRASALREARLRQARSLAEAVRSLRDAARPLLRATTWSAWSEAAEAIFREHLQGFREAAAGEGDPGAGAVLLALAGMRDLEAAGVPFTPQDAAAHLDATLREASLPIRRDGWPGAPQDDEGGVRILDAMQARGLAFDAVFLIGFNADLFPRRLREDPFLSDRDRGLLRAGLSRPVPLTSAGRDEEHLLLAHLLGSARRWLAVSWQRADESGRASVPSLALREVARLALGAADLRKAEGAARRLPAHPLDAGKDAIARHGILPVPEARLGAALEMRSPALLLERWPRLPGAPQGDEAGVLAAGLRLLAAVEGFSPADLGYDAVVREALPPPHDWSPSRLERLGACAQHYFFRHGLGVEELEEPAEGFELETVDLGLAVHAALHDIYRTLKGTGDSESPRPLAAAAVDRALEEAPAAWERHTRALSARLGRRYPLLWETTSRLWLGAIEDFVRRDVSALAAAGARLIGVEQEAAARIALGATAGTIEVHGRFDRLWRGEGGDLVVSDYKTSGDPGAHTDMAAILKGSRLQMPLYVLLAESVREGRPSAGGGVRAEVLGVGPGFASGDDPDEEDESRADLDAGTFEKHRRGLLETIGVLVGLAGAGVFPLNEKSRLCRYCPYLRACRRSHAPTLERLRLAPDAGPYALLRRKSTRAPLLADVRARAAAEEEA